MTLEIGLVLGILVAAFVLFITERLRMDVVALLVMSVLAITGLVTPAEALAGFSNPAVITVWAMFILSAGLTNVGIAELLGRRLLAASGRSEPVTVAVLMITAGVLSAFMNNVGVAALMLPVVMNIARRTGIPPSRLLMPLAFGSLLGGLTTLVGTPPNLLVSNTLREAGRPAFGMFDYTPVGGAVLIIGTLFVVFVGRFILPRRDPARESSPGDSADLRRTYELDQLSAVLRLPADSGLDGKPLKNSRLRRATGLNVYAILRGGEVDVAPDPTRVLRSGDRLLVHGKLERFEELRTWHDLVVDRSDLSLADVVSEDFSLREVHVGPSSELVDRTVRGVDLRRRFDVMALAVRRDATVLHAGIAGFRLRAGDTLLIFGHRDALSRVGDLTDVEVEPPEMDTLADRYLLRERLYSVRVPAESVLVGTSLHVSRLGDALNAGVLAVVREGGMVRSPGADDLVHAGDELIVRGDPGDLENFRALRTLEVETEKATASPVFETEGVQLLEVMLAPRSSLVGRTLRDLDFRDRYGLQVLALLTRGEIRYSGLGNTKIGLGDALLCVGSPERAGRLSEDPDFLILNVEERKSFPPLKAWVGGLVMAAVVASVLLGHFPIAIAAVAGVSLMLLLGCLSMEQAYRAIEWRAVFLIAGMLPLGTAMSQTGAASYLAQGLVSALSPFGAWGVLIGLYLMTAALTSVVPTAALVVLVGPIVLDAAARLGLSEQALMMAVAMAASASFTSPISHPANVIVMGPGGYRFIDYVKLGVPLTLVVMAVVMLVLPFFYPLQP